MSKRERLLIWAVALLVGFFALDRLVVTPLQAKLGQLRADADAVEQRIDEGRVLIDNRTLIGTRWAGRVASGLDLDAAAARLRVQGMLSEFAESSGLALANLSAGGELKAEDFTEVRFGLTATGELAQVTRFLKQLEEAPVPLAVLTCDISRRDEANSRLTLRMTVSTLVYLPKETAQ